MKRNIYKNISLAVLALLATACQNNDELGSAYDNDPNAVVVNASIGARTQTRVSTESATARKCAHLRIESQTPCAGRYGR